MTTDYFNPAYHELACVLEEHMYAVRSERMLDAVGMLKVVLGRLEAMGVDLSKAVQHLAESKRYTEEHGDCPFGMLSSSEQQRVRDAWAKQDAKSPKWLETLEA